MEADALGWRSKRRITMTNGHNGDRLSWGDALFLYLEREGMPQETTRSISWYG